MGDDGVALLKHAAPTSLDEDVPTASGNNWEVAWMLRRAGTSLHTPRHDLPMKFNSSGQLSSGQSRSGESSAQLLTPTAIRAVVSKEEEAANLMLARNARVEIDLLIQQAGRYYLAFDMTPPEKSRLSFLGCCMPLTYYVNVRVELQSVATEEGADLRPFGSGFSVTRDHLTTSMRHGVHSSGSVVLATEFSLLPNSTHGRFRFDLTNSKQQFRLKAVLETSRFSVTQKEVSVKLNRRKVAESGDSTLQPEEDMNAMIRRSHSRMFFESSQTQNPVQSSFLQNDALKRFVVFLNQAIVKGVPSRLRRAGSETFHDAETLMKELAYATKDREKDPDLARIRLLPLGTRHTGFVEDLTALRENFGRANRCEGDNEAAESPSLGTSKVHGRSVLLRGVNLSGNTKLPVGDATELPHDWSSMKNAEYCQNSITFTGRPFPLDQADEHLARISRWGFNCLRFLVTWEALEHGGPGHIDFAYIEYVEEIVRKAGEHDLYVFIDPHQDVWSRFTGGSGAPAWTLELCGLDIEKMEKCGACFTHSGVQEFKKMSWPQNYQRFATMHMFTLFFGGKQFAPDFFVDSEWIIGSNPEVPRDHPNSVHVQDFMQDRFIACMRAVAERLAKYPHVLGFDSLNEPSAGFIGKALGRHPERIIPNGLSFRPIEAMACASGLKVSVRVANAIGLLTSSEMVNDTKTSVWLEGRTDIWRANGLWRKVKKRSASPPSRPGMVVGDDEEYEIISPRYFVQRGDGSTWNYFRDFLRPFAERYIGTLREVRSNFLLFLEGDAFGHSDFYWSENSNFNVVNATHWYDGITLFMRRYNPNMTIDVKSNWPVFGKDNVRNMHLKDLRMIMSLPRDCSNALKPVVMPTLIGEFGCPFDLNESIGLKTGDFSAHTRALESYYSIFDEIGVSSTQWTYCAENSNVYGDHWNMENLSIFSTEQQRNVSDPDSGARALKGFCRPYAPTVAGSRLLNRFDPVRCEYILRYLPGRYNFEHGDPLTCTLVYLPDCHFLFGAKAELKIEVKNATYVLVKLPGRHVLYVWATHAGPLGIVEPVEVKAIRVMQH